MTDTDWKAVAASADDVIRAVLDALGKDYAADPIIAAREVREARDGWAARLGEYASAWEGLTRIVHMHVPDDDGDCEECGNTFPCNTYKVADESLDVTRESEGQES